MYIKPQSKSGNGFENQSDQFESLEIQELPMSMLIPSICMAALTFIIGLVWISGALTPFLNAVNMSFGIGVIQ